MVAAVLMAGVMPGVATLPTHADSLRPKSIPLCSAVTLSASYLAEVAPGRGPGFRFTLVNKTSRAIKLAEPIPSSSHWYARVQLSAKDGSRARWMWRASNGAGGSLVNAENERGPVIVYPVDNAEVKVVTVAPRQSRVWIESPEENPVLEYKPGCAQCSYPGESEYQVIFAYAYQPSAGREAGLLPCGLRSVPVPMPPKH
jgi:hypothetical protein